MSFVKKAVKKVFKGLKKVVSSKVFKWVAIAAAVFFTAGVAAGGFAAFTGVSGVGSFFTAVGQTMATGGAAMASGLGMTGVSSSLASHGGAAAIQAGLTTSATSATGAALTANAAAGTITSVPAAGGTSGVLAGKGGAIALSAKGTAAATAASAAAANVAAAEAALGMTIQPGTALYTQAAAGAVSNTGVVTAGLTTAGKSAGMSSAVWQGISTGAVTVAASLARKDARIPKTFVAGGLSRGGSSKAGPQPFFVVGGPRGTSAAAQSSEAPRAPASQDSLTLAGQLASAEYPTDDKATSAVAQNVGGGILQTDRARGGPANVPAAISGTTDAGVLATVNPAQEAPSAATGQVATNITRPTRDQRSFEDRILGGVLSGVS